SSLLNVAYDKGEASFAQTELGAPEVEFGFGFNMLGVGCLPGGLSQETGPRLHVAWKKTSNSRPDSSGPLAKDRIGLPVFEQCWLTLKR
ncbi:hypothetical protein AVEN_207628-1, partial [Araneus ventricosus]